MGTHKSLTFGMHKSRTQQTLLLPAPALGGMTCNVVESQHWCLVQAPLLLSNLGPCAREQLPNSDGPVAQARVLLAEDQTVLDCPGLHPGVDATLHCDTPQLLSQVLQVRHSPSQCPSSCQSLALVLLVIVTCLGKSTSRASCRVMLGSTQPSNTI
ncbi:hypothetical protein HaLaN_13563 [Haematococcus lacustris]|uniref:Uncharacterized protein n=1 Tax=Haematococcus lacustris TaxID=44745 RepID=A0A699ZDG8_HAELA|nr:hypothetical protein HaLaN_13563 [Haematococcus lacustris]